MQALRDAINELLISGVDGVSYGLFVWLPGFLSEGAHGWLLSLLLVAMLLSAISTWVALSTRRERALLRGMSERLAQPATSTTLVRLFFDTLFRCVRAPAACFYLATVPDRPLLLRVKQSNPAAVNQPDWEPELRIEGFRAEPWATRKGNLAILSIAMIIDGHPLALVQIATTTAKDLARARARVRSLRALLTPILAQLVSLERIQRLEERAAEASVVSGSSQRLLNVSLAPEELGSLLLELIVNSTAADAGLIVVAGDADRGRRPRVLASSGLAPQQVDLLARPVGESLPRERLRAVDRAIAPSTPEIEGLVQQSGFRSFLQVPIADAGPPLGAILLVKREGVFRENHSRICLLNATRLALTLKNRAYHEAAFNQYKETLRTIVTTYESANPYSQGHSVRIARLTSELAARLGLPKHEIEGVRLAGELHDLGMAGLGEEILANANQLTEPQYDLVKHHPAIGASLTAPIQLPVPIAPLILHHHERYDGFGYPAGLKGGEIPMGARILALAEVWDALVTSRSYRPGFEFPEGVKRLRALAGTQLDPDVVDAFAQSITADRWRHITQADTA